MGSGTGLNDHNKQEHPPMYVEESDISKSNKGRKWFFGVYVSFLAVLVLRLVYEIADNITIIMYRPVGMADEGVTEDLIKELTSAIAKQNHYLFSFLVFAVIQIIISIFVFVKTKK